MRAPERKLGGFLSAIIGLAGNAPAYSVAVTIMTLVAASGGLSPLLLALCAILILGIARAYRRLNARKPSGGAAFTWVSEYVHPLPGFFAGWALLVASMLFLLSASLPAAQVLFGIVGVDAQNKLYVSLAAGVIIVIFALIAASGVFRVGRFQSVLTSLEVAVLIALLLIGLANIGGGVLVETAVGRSHWNELSWQSLSKGMVIAIFFFWGWDVIFNASEETANTVINSGRAAYFALALLAAIFVVYSVLALTLIVDADVQTADGNALVAISRKVLPQPWSEIALLSFLLSTLGALSASFVQFSQTLYAQAKVGFFSRRLASARDSTSSPRAAIFVDAVAAIVLLAISGISATIEQIINSTIASSSVFVAYYYGATGLSSIVSDFKLKAAERPRIAATAFSAVSVAALVGCAVLAAISFDQLTRIMIGATVIVGLCVYALRRRM